MFVLFYCFFFLLLQLSVCQTRGKVQLAGSISLALPSVTRAGSMTGARPPGRRRDSSFTSRRTVAIWREKRIAGTPQSKASRHSRRRMSSAQRLLAGTRRRGSRTKHSLPHFSLVVFHEMPKGASNPSAATPPPPYCATLEKLETRCGPHRHSNRGFGDRTANINNKR